MKFFFNLIIFLCFIGCTTTKEKIEVNIQIENASEENISEIKKRAEKGDINAQTILGVHYFNGHRFEKSFALLHKAALENHPIATNFLGLMYINGNGVQKNSIDGIKWLKKSFDAGNDIAKEILGNHFGKRLEWKISNMNSRGLLILEDKSGNVFPDKTLADGLFNDMKLLQLDSEKNNEVTVMLIIEDCLIDEKDLCTENIDFALFRPDWSLAGEFLNTKPYLIKPILRNGKNILINEIMTIDIEPKDPLGIYSIVVRIHQQNEVLYEFTQMFNVVKG